ncbi:phosphatidylserine decarboxylase [Clostridium cavendishii DSM 21758]|uniref:Phosphatidylserine decarboxylase proenzyme n=1 Tax=Clostridium cavendishii DSM 21758 TaxID=1121302 RepID=A0A1M6SU05_9CLOT|nr:phosphatidylserine decarboxylase [Clostridium cavendishii]SHK48110.1 phosphatidylserine decarboxylase [Clostridium cavendishii DSM 21758]
MIKIYNRVSKQYEEEQVAGKKYIEWSYMSPVGKSFTELLIKKKLFSKLFGSFYDSPRSMKKVKPFIDEFNIDMSLCESSLSDFNCFNDFFIRKLTKDARPIDMSPEKLVSPGDGRLLAFDNIDMDNLVQVKGFTYSLEELLGDKEVASKYNGGVCLILRLCPTDYHRFHFIDNGSCGHTHKIEGAYYSVNPIALNNIPKLFCQNKREWSIFKSENFGDVIHVEVGATCVGTIIQSYTPNTPVTKGSEKGYFKFGGSTTVLFFKKDTIKIDEDILEQTNLGFETKVSMGETIGSKI